MWLPLSAFAADWQAARVLRPQQQRLTLQRQQQHYQRQLPRHAAAVLAPLLLLLIGAVETLEYAPLPPRAAGRLGGQQKCESEKRSRKAFHRSRSTQNPSFSF